LQQPLPAGLVVEDHTGEVRLRPAWPAGRVYRSNVADEEAVAQGIAAGTVFRTDAYDEMATDEQVVADLPDV